MRLCRLLQAERRHLAELEEMQRQAAEDRARLAREHRAANCRLSVLQQRLAELDAEEAGLRRTVAEGVTHETDARLSRLAVLEHERKNVRKEILQMEQATLRGQLAGVARSFEDELFFGNDYTAWAAIGFERDSGRRMQRRLDDITRELGALSTDENAAECRKHAAETEMEGYRRKQMALDEHEAALMQRLRCGNQAFRGNAKLRRKLESVRSQQRSNLERWCTHPSCSTSTSVALQKLIHGKDASHDCDSVVAANTVLHSRSSKPKRLQSSIASRHETKHRTRFCGSGSSLSRNGGWFLHRQEMYNQLESELTAPKEGDDSFQGTRPSTGAECRAHHAKVHSTWLSRCWQQSAPSAAIVLRRPPSHADIKDADAVPSLCRRLVTRAQGSVAISVAKRLKPPRRGTSRLLTELKASDPQLCQRFYHAGAAAWSA